MSTTPQPIYEVDPDRLSDGRWSHEDNRRIDEGDIVSSYSGDTIAMHHRIRRPFNFHGGQWTCVGKWSNHGSDSLLAEAYRLVATEGYVGTATDYVAKIKDCEAARNDPMGFYHGGKSFILTGPPVDFVAGQEEQPGLFGDG